MAVKELPQVGLGTWLLTDFDELHASIETALSTGYQHIDTAQVYNNEYDIGLILKKLAVDRSKLFLTTKVAPMNYQQHLEESVHESLRRLQTDYLDLVLLHAEVSEELNEAAYKGLLALKASGVIRHVGVSNFSVSGIQRLVEATGEIPYCNQIVCSPTTRPLELEAYCLSQGIKLVGYSIIKPYFTPNPFYPESGLTVAEKLQLDQLCQKYSISIGQLLNKWALTLGYAIIPKSSKPSRVKENQELDFELTEADVAVINQMNRFSADQYQAMVRQWHQELTKESLAKGLLYDQHFVR